ncbi:HdeD family acid-resistance protein [Serratia rhizosphaerae]|uniref:HdeD family acid-resistance protein n=1 Tax=Serratia rhizosphaerae TaxID=2597702 RepID=A0ABX6GNJ2_9GAMM|nr:HdeD family acid-resistance protein [Serratia rhizosphaerae]QHA87842.1 HdeD family acid-resistance protein [Serratia rhizosphaerae]
MLNIGNNHLSALDPQLVKKQRRLLLALSLLLLVAGLFCLFSPFASGAALSVVMGVFLLLSGIGMIVGMIVNRAQNTWPMIGGILLGIAYLIIGYVFITSPAVGIFTMAIYLAALFALGGVFRLLAGYQLRALPGNGIQYAIGVLDLAIAWMLLSADAATSVVLVTTIVGIEMLFSAFGLFMVTRRFSAR